MDVSNAPARTKPRKGAVLSGLLPPESLHDKEKKMQGFRWTELVWQRADGKRVRDKLVMTIYFIVKDTPEAKSKCVTDFLKEVKWKTRIKRTSLGNCISKRYEDTDKIDFVIGVSGDSLQERMAIAAHEAHHLAVDFWRGRKLHKNSSVNREEHMARLVESVVREYYRLCESQSPIKS